jgi:dipeptidase E
MRGKPATVSFRWVSSMRTSLLIVSTNLALPWLAPEVRGVVGKCSRAAIITNGEPRRPTAGGDARLASEALRRAGLGEVDLVDLLADQPLRLAAYDCLCLAGGNPFHLLHCLRSSGADNAIDEMVAAGRPVIAAGVASCILGRTIAHLRELGLCVPAMGCRDMVALGLLPFSVVPSANRWRSCRREFSATLKNLEARYGPILTLDDDEALRAGPGLGIIRRMKRSSGLHHAG